MTTRQCDGCGTEVRIAGGIADLWNFEFGGTEGMILELADGSEHFLCLDCTDRLPDDRDPTADDVAALPSDDAAGVSNDDAAGVSNDDAAGVSNDDAAGVSNDDV